MARKQSEDSFSEQEATPRFEAALCGADATEAAIKEWPTEKGTAMGKATDKVRHALTRAHPRALKALIMLRPRHFEL
jgi:hypothetical protein